MIDVTVVLLNDNYASTAIGPIEVFHSAGLLWNQLKGEPLEPRFRVTTASLDGETVSNPYPVQLVPADLHPRHQEGRLDHCPLIGPGSRQPVRASRRIVPLAAQARGPRVLSLQAAVPAPPILPRPASWTAGRRPRIGPPPKPSAGAIPRSTGGRRNLITEDRRMLCSGGVYSSMDLSLYLVEKFCGHEVAVQCAESLAHQHAAPLPVGLRRPAALATA
jgi:hypothetical protein